MAIHRSLRAIGAARTDRVIDWDAAARAAQAGTPRGELALDDTDRGRYSDAVSEAHRAIEAVLERQIDRPGTVEVLDRHHWIDRTATSFERMVEPVLAGVSANAIAGTVNTATAGATLGLLARRVVGQFDPGLFGADDEVRLWLVHPNLVEVAASLSVDPDRFRRWVVHHEMAHAAEFTVAPWLSGHLEDNLEQTMATLHTGRLDRASVAELDRTMTTVEGFAELLMDEAMHGEVDDLRRRLDARRAGLNPLVQLLDRLLGIAAKRRQYRRGQAFFRHVADARGLDATVAVWREPAALPTSTELDRPDAWIERVLESATDRER